MIDEGSPFRIVRRISHEQGRTGHGQAGAELLIEHQAAGRMKARTPVVGVLQAPLQDADLDVRVLRGAHVVPQLYEVVADAPQAGLEVLGLVLVVVTAEYVKVLLRRDR